MFQYLFGNQYSYILRNSLAFLHKSRAMKSKVQLKFKLILETYARRIFQILKKKLNTFCSYVLGGTHMTNPALLVNRILKELTATEDNFYGWYYILGSHQIIYASQRVCEHQILVLYDWRGCRQGTTKALQVKNIIHMFFKKNLGNLFHSCWKLFITKHLEPRRV